MSFLRPVLLALAALFVAPTAALAETDECLGRIHVFIDAEIDGDGNTVKFTSQHWCLMEGESPDEEPFEDGKPYRGHLPEWLEESCESLEHQIDYMRRTLARAHQYLPGAIKARDEALEETDAAPYLDARGEWLKALEALEAAKRTYEGVYDTEVEIERHGGGVVTERRTGYNANTALGRAVHEAMRREHDARKAMEDAFAKLAAAQAAQFRVDQYTNVIDTYPAAIEEALAHAAKLGCK